MSEPNAQQAGNFATDAVVDTEADKLANTVIDNVVCYVPGGEAAEQMLNTEVDQDLNNEINAEVNKGVGGVISDVEGMFGHS